MTAKLKAIIEAYGIPLTASGVHGVALHRSAALKAIDVIRETTIAILGGDVFSQNGHNAVKLTHDNWHVDRMEGEEQQIYLKRSWDTAERFIRYYKCQINEDPLFHLVFSVQP